MAPVTFTSSKSWLITLVIWGTTLLLVFVFVQDMLTGSSVVGSVAKGVFLLLTIGFLLWTWFGTYYRVAGNHLTYRCGPLHGRIPIQDIRIIKQHERLWSGLRPALGFRGMVVHYDKWDEIYISPERQEEFIERLKRVNPGILVK